VLPFKNPGDFEKIEDGLRKAGVVFKTKVDQAGFRLSPE
jgi:hypothetical protein